MKSLFRHLGFTATALSTLALASETFHVSLPELSKKRNFLTCEETYGNGSITCGAVGSHYCYNPTLGETCCPLDDGYCGPGDFCAPVAGYCCHNTESPGVCAKCLSFTLPSTYSYDVGSSILIAPSTYLAAASDTPEPSIPIPSPSPSPDGPDPASTHTDDTNTSPPLVVATPTPTQTATTIQVALAPSQPTLVFGLGAVVSATTEGTYIPEKTAPVDMFNLTSTSSSSFSVTGTATAIVDGALTTTTSTPYLQASGAVGGNARARVGFVTVFVFGVVGMMVLML